MSELSDLYQEVILDHNRQPRNYHKIEGTHRKAEGYNPLCGDQLTVYVQLEDGVIRDISFEGSGCAISKASASLMTTSVKGKTLAQARALFAGFHDLITDGHDAPQPVELGKLAVFVGVRQFPSRVKCASLAWHTMRAALEGEQVPVSTESVPATGEGVDDATPRTSRATP
ncbi:MAG: Fe-S cluster assembly sulfur transfer protein SufU [Candidatus Binatia bacterium]